MAYDMDDVFKIPSTYNGNLPADDCEAINLFQDCSKTDLSLVIQANEFYYAYGAEYHAENIEWSGEKISNSCSASLRNKILEEVQDFKVSEKGGPVDFKIMMDLVIVTSDTAMRAVVNRINDLKLSDFDGENVLLFGSYVRGATLLLKNHNAIPHDLTQLIYKGLKMCSCVEFTEYITALQNTDKLNLDHMLKDCKLPFNQDTIDKRKANSIFQFLKRRTRRRTRRRQRTR